MQHDSCLTPASVHLLSHLYMRDCHSVGKRHQASHLVQIICELSGCHITKLQTPLMIHIPYMGLFSCINIVLRTSSW